MIKFVTAKKDTQNDMLPDHVFAKSICFVMLKNSPALTVNYVFSITGTVSGTQVTAIMYSNCTAALVVQPATLENTE